MFCSPILIVWAFLHKHRAQLADQLDAQKTLCAIIMALVCHFTMVIIGVFEIDWIHRPLQWAELVMFISLHSLDAQLVKKIRNKWSLCPWLRSASDHLFTCKKCPYGANTFPSPGDNLTRAIVKRVLLTWMIVSSIICWSKIDSYTRVAQTSFYRWHGMKHMKIQEIYGSLNGLCTALFKMNGNRKLLWSCHEQKLEPSKDHL